MPTINSKIKEIEGVEKLLVAKEKKVAKIDSKIIRKEIITEESKYRREEERERKENRMIKNDCLSPKRE